MPVFPYGQTVTIVRRTVSGTDEYGNDVYSSSRTDVALCVVAPDGAGSENLDFADQLTSGIVVYFPEGTDISYIDAVIFNGEQYEVQGTSQEWTSPFSGRVAPVQVRATKVTGVTA